MNTQNLRKPFVNVTTVTRKSPKHKLKSEELKTMKPKRKNWKMKPLKKKMPENLLEMPN